MRYLRILIFLFLAAIGYGLLLLGWGYLFSPEIAVEEVVYPEEILQDVEKARRVEFDRENPPVVQVEVDYSLGRRGGWYPKGESPILAELVQEGKLPPVEVRVGPEPVVLAGEEGIGNYGGTWFRVTGDMRAAGVIKNRLSGSNLVRWSPMGYPIRPHLAKGWKVSDDFREWTFYLRKGVRWSDGHPFTADDILYWWEREDKYFRTGRPHWMVVKGEEGDVRKIDDYTVQFIFPQPHGLLLEMLAGGNECYSPKHYLQQYHPEDGDPKLIREAMMRYGATSERSLYLNILKSDYSNTDCPRMWPWICRADVSHPPEYLVRNPYYWAVDEEGNQLPYVDRIIFDVRSPQLIPIAAASGELTMQLRDIRYEDYTLLMENRTRNDYDIYHWFPAGRSLWTLWPNLNRHVPEGDLAADWKAKLLREKKFRQALSLSINRQDIIRALYLGVGTPSQIEPGIFSDFHSPELQQSYIDYEPERASAMLDELGLITRDRDGMRTFPDGSRMVWYIDFTKFVGEGPAQFIVDDWANVGIRAVQRERSGPLFAREKSARLHDFTVAGGEGEFNPMMQPRSFVPFNSESHHAIGYGRWFQGGGLYGLPAAGFGGVEPEPDGVIWQMMNTLEEARYSSRREDQVALFQEIAKIAAENVWTISIATPPPQLVVVKNGFRNVPKNAITGWDYGTPSNAGVETFFFENPSDSKAAIEQIKDSMVNFRGKVKRTNKAVQGSGETRYQLGKVIMFLIVGIGILSLILSGIKHPYIGRRLLIMVPTLFIISVVTFTIVQMPPGDFVETRILELRQQGDESAVAEVLRLREAFYLDEPLWMQYSRWMGLRWFVTFESIDKGLLQGHMGKSMELEQRTVNSMVGDRILLTFLVSLGTLLFTWAIAVPIGIYSAVRQYTTGDYILSFIGFIGMCVPNFLLAIIMMYWSSKYLGINVTGLFSPEYAADPSWSWGKVVDLFKHIWVPIVVIATGGTAGMIRVMRGNLLDELRKPYVTTARAKGVRPFKLLMKYPVRLALNPFISGVGGIFPHLVSGGAIVAIVLSLPMIGPLLLNGLMTQDIYMTASMLMVLSLLGVFGTLVSDLLLMWVDPRIRMEGVSEK